MNDYSVLTDLLPPGVGSTIEWTFDCLTIAEQQIEAAQDRHPQAGEQLNKAFRALQPSEALSAKRNRQLYAGHVTELLERVATGTDLRPATRAEVLATLSEISLVAPLGHDRAVLFLQLFRQFFPNTPASEGPEIHESYKGASAAVLAELRRKLRQERLQPRPGV